MIFVLIDWHNMQRLFFSLFCTFARVTNVLTRCFFVKIIMHFLFPVITASWPSRQYTLLLLRCCDRLPSVVAAAGRVYEGAALLHRDGVHVPGEPVGVPPPRQQVSVLQPT
jgi:hypothetical protein